MVSNDLVLDSLVLEGDWEAFKLERESDIGFFVRSLCIVIDQLLKLIIRLFFFTRGHFDVTDLKRNLINHFLFEFYVSHIEPFETWEIGAGKNHAFDELRLEG